MDIIRINVPLRKAEAQILIKLAHDEHRHPREQAAYMLEKLLKSMEHTPEPVKPDTDSPAGGAALEERDNAADETPDRVYAADHLHAQHGEQGIEQRA